MEEKKWDVFISYAHEDKESIARPLAEELSRQGLKVWFDEFLMDKSREIFKEINDGMANSKYAIAIISLSYLSKDWTIHEFSGLYELSDTQEIKILPVWHDISKREIANKFPLVITLSAVATSTTDFNLLVKKIMRVIKPPEINHNVPLTPDSTNPPTTNEKSKGLLVMPGKLIDDKTTLPVPQSDLLKYQIKRYLDCMDSVRFSVRVDEKPDLLLRHLYLKAQFVLAILSGDVIVVTENQFFDSRGFLEIYGELCSFAKSDNLPIRIALSKRSPNLILYDLVADYFSTIRNDSGELEPYHLSGWPELSEDLKRREHWADAIRHGKKPTEVHPGETIWLDRLFSAMEGLKGQIIPTAPVTSDDLLEKLFSMLNEGNIEERIDHFRKNAEGLSEMLRTDTVFNSAKCLLELVHQCALKAPIKKRSQVKNWLRLNGSFHTNSGRNITWSQKEGLLELTDLLYNQVVGIFSSAPLIHISTYRSPYDDNYVKAAYMLAVYIRRQKSINSSDLKISIEAHDWVKNRVRYDTRQIEKVLANVPWEKLLSCTEHEEWCNSLRKYKLALFNLEEKVTSYERGETNTALIREIEREEPEVIELWNRHIEESSFINNDYWCISDDSIHLLCPEGNPGKEIPVFIQYEPLTSPIRQAISYPELGLNEKIKGQLERRVKFQGL
jgi:hypothetical protein